MAVLGLGFRAMFQGGSCVAANFLFCFVLFYKSKIYPNKNRSPLKSLSRMLESRKVSFTKLIYSNLSHNQNHYQSNPPIYRQNCSI